MKFNDPLAFLFSQKVSTPPRRVAACAPPQRVAPPQRPTASTATASASGATATKVNSTVPTSLFRPPPPMPKIIQQALDADMAKKYIKHAEENKMPAAPNFLFKPPPPIPTGINRTLNAGNKKKYIKHHFKDRISQLWPYWIPGITEDERKDWLGNIKDWGSLPAGPQQPRRSCRLVMKNGRR
jgi:hypothetical protein